MELLGYTSKYQELEQNKGQVVPSNLACKSSKDIWLATSEGVGGTRLSRDTMEECAFGGGVKLLEGYSNYWGVPHLPNILIPSRDAYFRLSEQANLCMAVNKDKVFLLQKNN